MIIRKVTGNHTQHCFTTYVLCGMPLHREGVIQCKIQFEKNEKILNLRKLLA